MVEQGLGKHDLMVREQSGQLYHHILMHKHTYMYRIAGFFGGENFCVSVRIHESFICEINLESVPDTVKIVSGGY